MTCSTENIYSTLASDPDYCDLVSMYVDEMPERIESIRDAHDSGDRDTLIRLIHQLKGAAGSYGFPMLTEEAASAEQLLIGGQAESAPVIDALLDVCSRLRTGIDNE